MLESGEEKELVGSSMVDAHGQLAATVRLRLLAQPALRAAWWLRARPEHLHIGLHSLSLSVAAAAAAVSHGCDYVRVRTDALGLAAAAPL
eukprot:5717139-Pleurochrysis_carterae.AAC.1